MALKIGLVWEGSEDDLKRIAESLLKHDRVVLTTATSTGTLNLVQNGNLLVHSPRDKRGEIRR